MSLAFRLIACICIMVREHRDECLPAASLPPSFVAASGRGKARESGVAARFVGLEHSI
jgi:hypothetical protein